MAWFVLLTAAAVHAAAWAGFLLVERPHRTGWEEVAARWPTRATVGFLVGNAASVVLMLVWAARWLFPHPAVAEGLALTLLYVPQFVLTDWLLRKKGRTNG